MSMRQQRKSKSAAAVLFEALEGRDLFSATITGLVHNDINGDGRLDEFSTAPATRVYVDANKNGRRDSGELSTLTDANGLYVLKNVPAGDTLVRFELPKGWVPSNATAHVGQSVIFTEGAKSISIGDAMIRYATAPWQTVGQNAQHTGVSPFRGGPLTGTPQTVTTEGSATGPTSTVSDSGFKLGTPLFTKYNTVIVSVFENGKFEVRAFSRAGGVQLWTFVSDYVEPPSVQLSLRTATAVFQPALGPDGKLYVPGAGGTVYVIAAPDQFVRSRDRIRTTDKQMAFYGIDKYRAKAGKFRGHLFINTPLTVGPNGDVYFGVEASGTNPLGITSSLARVRANGTGGRVGAAVVTGSAPALSNDNGFVYVATQTGATAKIERFRAGSLGRAGSQELIDPLNKTKRIQLTPGIVSVPVVAPDGDVYLATPAKAQVVTADGNGWLMRFSGDLKTVKATNAQVMEDATPSIVPASMVPSYHGKSSYLVVAVRFTPQDASGYQRLSLFDPAASLKRTGAEFLLPLAQFQDQDGQTQQTLGFVSSPVTVDPSSGAIYLVNASESLLRWNVSDVKEVTAPLSLGQVIEQEGGSPAVIGPDGEVYAVVNGALVGTF